MNLKEYTEKEKLLLPNYDNLNIVDLVRFLYSKYGISCENNANIKKLKEFIPNKKHTLLIVIDGMGSNLIDILNSKSILKKNKKTNMITVSPSSTACVLTSLATATYPIEHGIIGWYNYNRKYNIDYYPLLFTDRKNNQNLKDLNINEKEIFKIDSKLNKLNVKTTVLYPDYIFDSVYSNYVANNDIRKPYTNLENAFDQVLKILTLDEETFTYLYIPDIDTLEHDYGFDDRVVLNKIKAIEQQLNRLTTFKDVTTIVTADHGQTNINNDITMDFKKYNKYFYAYPGIDFGMATYYVKAEMQQEFIKEFKNDYKDKMHLFETKDFIENNIFGNHQQIDHISDNLGEYISLCNSDSQFINSTDIEEYFGKTKGNHSGLTKDEMLIPLIVIETQK